jgi:thiol-disulfide isomerase/thioredoxin
LQKTAQDQTHHYCTLLTSKIATDPLVLHYCRSGFNACRLHVTLKSTDMWIRGLFVLVLSSTFSFAGIVEDVRTLLSQKNFPAAETELNRYQAQRGVTPEYLEALSWMARAHLQSQQFDQATQIAKKTQSLCIQQLRSRALDSEPHLPMALGNALEVQGQALASEGKRNLAVAFLRQSLASYGHTSLRARLQKNLNLLQLTGGPAPPLALDRYLGPKPSSLTQLKGSPVLLFFWAHWCADCKAEAPIITQLRSEFGQRGLMVVAPTQLYGYAAGGENASPKDELPYIERVWQHFYPGLQSVPVPISKTNFDVYGASTTPTLVLLDRAGRVSFYHPGALTYPELRAAVEGVVSR